jgi:uncharacterized protein with PQ loop repeat
MTLGLFSVETHARITKRYEQYMVFIAVLGSLIIYFQAGVVIHNKSSENVSLVSYILLLIVALSAAVYGIIKFNWVIILSGLVTVIGSILALVSTVSYRPSSNSGPFTML